MGIVRRIIEEIVNIPLDEIRLRVFTETLPQVSTEVVLGVALMLGAFLGIGLWGFVTGVTGLVMWMATRGLTPHRLILLVVVVVLGLLWVDGLVDFLLPVADELRKRR